MPTFVLVHGAFAESASWGGSTRSPGSTLGEALQPVPHGDGTVDLLIIRDRFHAQFCADLDAHRAELMSVTQRPVAQAALEDPSGPDPLWKRVPSCFVIGAEDRNIPAELQRSLAVRANPRRTVDLAGASHAVAVSRPIETADLILEAAALPVVA
jgi:pimeloyl-ACP methyl ester carboxylesterase